MFNYITSFGLTCCMQVLELGIVVHSVVIGLSLGASNNTCTIKGLVAALCFHQLFEGMGLGGCILQVFHILTLFVLQSQIIRRNASNTLKNYRPSTKL